MNDPFDVFRLFVNLYHDSICVHEKIMFW